MARFSVGGDEDGNEDRHANRRPTKRSLPNWPNQFFNKRPTATATATTNSRDRPTTSTAASPELRFGRTVPSEPVHQGYESERQSSEESGSSWSDTATDSSSTEEEEEEEEEDLQQQPPQTGGEVQPAVRRVDPIADGSGEGTSGSVSVTLSDPDVLDCPICYEPLSSPVYQCENGHIACASCCNTMKNKCANCCWPIGYNRCRAIEKVLESVKITCRNMPHGCKETFSYSKKLAHEKACTYTPCSCPYLGCDFVGISKSVYAHFAVKHAEVSDQFDFDDMIYIPMEKNQNTVYLQEKKLKTLFILNRSVESVGSFVNVVCVAPTSEKKPYVYDLTAVEGGSMVKLESSVDFVPKWVVQSPRKVYLIVPGCFISSSGELDLRLRIQRNPVYRG